MTARHRVAWLVAATTLVSAACTFDDPPAAVPSGTPQVLEASPVPTEVVPDRGAREGGSLKYQLIAEPEFIDPGFALESEGLAVVDALFDSLFAVTDDLSVVPAVAAAWTVDDTGTIYRFTLRRGERFHDGTPVTSDDVVRAWNRVVRGAPGELSPNAHLLAEVVGYDDSVTTGTPLEGVRAIDKRTLKVVLATPNFEFPAVLSHPSLAPVPAGVDSATFRDDPIGNGPFEMAQPWQHGRFIRVVRNEDYAGRRPSLDEVVFQIYGEEGGDQDAYRDFEEGRLHYAVVPPDELDQARAIHGRSPDGYSGPGVVDGVNLTLYYFGFNVESPPFDDPVLRRAISMAIDREGIAEELLGGTRIPADRLLPPGIPGSVEGTCAYCSYDPEGARALLVDLEVEPVTIAYNAHPAQEAIARRVAGDLRRNLGLEVSLESHDFDEYLQSVRAGALGFFRLGWQAEFPSADNYLTTLLASERIGDTNVTRFRDPAVDELLARARAERDPARRAETYTEAERLALDPVPLVPLMFYRHNRIIDDTVRDLVVRPDGSIDLTRVWLTDAA